MVGDALGKAIFDRMKPADKIALLIMVSLFIGMFFVLWNFNTHMQDISQTVNLTYDKVIEMESREFEQIYDRGAAVMNTLISQGFETHEEIQQFLAPKPAGRTDLKTALNNEKTYARLVDTYGELAKVAKRAIDF